MSEANQEPSPSRIPRRAVLGAAAAAAGFAGLQLAGGLSVLPNRLALAQDATGTAGATGTAEAAAAAVAGATPTAATPTAATSAAATFSDGISDIQFDISQYTRSLTLIDGVEVKFPPVHTLFATARLQSRPQQADQRALEAALITIERYFPWHPAGVFTQVAYGLPYFLRFPAQLRERLVPRLSQAPNRFVLEEAVPGPTDVHPSNPDIRKERFNQPVRIEDNDLLFTVRSDVSDHVADVVRWLGGSNTLRGQHEPSPVFACGLQITSTRAMFAQRGLPRRIAELQKLRFAGMIHPDSPMWMGFLDQQTAASAPAGVVTFAGGEGVRMSSAKPGDYFDNGSVQHLSHVILDLDQFYRVVDSGANKLGSFHERVQYMFRSTPPPHPGFTDQFTNGGGPTSLPALFKGVDDAERSAQGIGTPDGRRRLGHMSALQRSSRTADGKPLHMRIDGPGFDDIDLTAGQPQPKLHFSIFVPSADFFASMRRNQASLDLTKKYGVRTEDNGLERFTTATRRQNFLIPPRRHRAFPMAELG